MADDDQDNGIGVKEGAAAVVGGLGTVAALTGAEAYQLGGKEALQKHKDRLKELGELGDIKKQARHDVLNGRAAKPASGSTAEVTKIDKIEPPKRFAHIDDAKVKDLSTVKKIKSTYEAAIAGKTGDALTSATVSATERAENALRDLRNTDLEALYKPVHDAHLEKVKTEVKKLVAPVEKEINATTTKIRNMDEFAKDGMTTMKKAGLAFTSAFERHPTVAAGAIMVGTAAAMFAANKFLGGSHTDQVQADRSFPAAPARA